jgi:hypothetical protein
MTLHVSLQRRRVGERAQAGGVEGANVRLLARVNALMNGQRRFLSQRKIRGFS